jgi:hypothetical protein
VPKGLAGHDPLPAHAIAQVVIPAATGRSGGEATMGVVWVSAGCVLASAEVELGWDRGWVEQISVEVLGEGGGCGAIDVPVPPGGALIVDKARLIRGAGPTLALDSSRWQVHPDPTRGGSVHRLHLPEVVGGDLLRLELVRTSPDARSYVWAPGREGAIYAGLRVAPDALLTVIGTPGVDGSGWLFQAEPPPELEVRVHPPTGPAPWPAAVTATTGLSAADALARVARLFLLPPGFDGPAPVTGDDAFARGAAEPVALAATVAALAAGGPDRVRVAQVLPDGEAVGATSVTAPDVVLIGDGDGARVVGWSDLPETIRVWDGERAVTAPTARGLTREAPDALVATSRVVTLDVPPGDPGLVLAPGSGSSALVEERIRPLVAGAPWYGRLPDGAVAVAVEGGVVRDGGVARLGAGETLVRYLLPDAPTFGEASPRPGEVLTEQVVGEGVVVRWEGSFWAMESVRGTPIVPDRASLVSALDRRFFTRSMPQPAVPGAARQAEGWDELATARLMLMGSVRAGGTPTSDPVWPRRLGAVRRSAWGSPIELVLYLRGWAEQLGWDADWVLVRPRGLGPGPEASPAGYSEALLRVRRVVDGAVEERWLDPSCDMCGPFEVRPELLGASALGRDVTQTPPPVPGRVEVDADDRRQRVLLDGPAALALRTALRSVPPEDRAKAIATRLGGPGARLLAASQVADAGAPIQLVVVGGAEVHDPLAEGTLGVWRGGRFEPRWVGTRVFVRPGVGAPSAFEGEGLVWSLVVDADGRVREEITLSAPSLDEATVAGWRAARAAALAAVE